MENLNKEIENQEINEAQNRQDNAVIIQKRIGSTIYNVSVYFSKTSKEDMDDKILRLIKNEVSTKEAV